MEHKQDHAQAVELLRRWRKEPQLDIVLPIDRTSIERDRELLAAYAHNAWAGWMRYLFSKSISNADGSVTIPPELVQRWQRQMNTAYADLPDEERESDRQEADKILSIVIMGE